MSIVNPSQLVAEFKKSGDFDRLRKEMLAEFQKSDAIIPLMSRVEDIVRQKLQSDKKLEYMPLEAVYRELMDELDRYPVVDRAVGDFGSRSDASFSGVVQNSLKHLLRNNRGQASDIDPSAEYKKDKDKNVDSMDTTTADTNSMDTTTAKGDTADQNASSMDTATAKEDKDQNPNSTDTSKVSGDTNMNLNSVHATPEEDKDQMMDTATPNEDKYHNANFMDITTADTDSIDTTTAAAALSVANKGHDDQSNIDTKPNSPPPTGAQNDNMTIEDSSDESIRVSSKKASGNVTADDTGMVQLAQT